MAFEQDSVHKKGDIHYTYTHTYISVYPCKTDTKYLIKKSINQSACMNAEIESGRGEKVCVPPTDI